MTTFLNYDKIKKLIYTEKSNKLVANDKYTFEIDYNCTKKEIASLIKKIFNVDVKKVNIINSFGKTKRFKGIVGSKSDIKKAIITLQTGQKINFD
ncbi:MAG: 50S ribosomal protein L23 [Proteobacteria bacterium]|jgi:large subunit ribosomal protein L23|nr:50S ribosomal protein L23 [Pseudomonadota bacterium]